MKTIEIEKHLELRDVIELLPLVMKDRFIYKQEEDGIRCIGPFFIKGRYTTCNEVKDFQDVFEFDIFAGRDKLDGTEFKLYYEGYDYTIKDGVTLYLHFSVQGVKEENHSDTQVEVVKTLNGEEETLPVDTFKLPEDEVINTEGVGTNYAKDMIYASDSVYPNQREGVSAAYFENKQTVQVQNVVSDISNVAQEGVGSETLVDDNTSHELFEIPRFSNKKETVSSLQEPLVIEKEALPKEEDIQVEQVMTSSTISKPKEEENNLQAMEELFDNKDSVAASYSFVVVKRGDTYSSIAQRYQVDEEKLKQANANKEIHERSLLVLPYLKV